MSARFGSWVLRVASVALATAVLATSGHAFIRLTNDSRGLHFSSMPVSYAIHGSGSSDVADQSEVAAIRLGFAAWSRVDGSALSFREDPRGATAQKVHANDGLNLVLFDEENSTGLFTGASYIIAITPVFYDAAGGILDADVVFNGKDHQFATNMAAGRYDVQNIATHEIGHLLGLDHTGVWGATLVPFAYPQDTRLRSLTPDDRAGATTIYPGSGAPQRASLAGQIIRDSNGRGIDAAHVVAVNVATGEPEASAIAGTTGMFTLDMLRPGTYRVYTEPLDGPCTDANIQRDGVETGFMTTFYGGNAQPQQATVSPGQFGVQLGQLRVRDMVNAFNIDGIANSTRQVVRGTTATISLSGQGLSAGLEVEVAGSGVRLQDIAPVNHGRLAAGASFSCSVDSGATPGLRDIYVYRGAGASREVVVLPGGFEIVAEAPRITSVSPTSGTAQGGDTVTIRGSSFAPGVSVLFGDQLASTVTFVNATQVTAVAPQSVVGPVAVTTINEDGQQARLDGGYTYVGIPILTAVTPSEGASAGGVTVTIDGQQLAQNAQVLFDQKAATGVAVTGQGTRLTCTSPRGTSGIAVDITVINPGATGGSATLRDVYTYIDPRLSGVDPQVGAMRGGTLVQVFGRGFSPGMRVDFGAIRATSVVFVSDGEIRATAPGGSAGTVNVTVIAADGRSDALVGAFRYVNGVEPAIASVSPNRSPTSGGAQLRIFGSNFDAPTVLFGSTPAQSVQMISANELLVVAPGNAPGATDVVVRNGPTGLQAKAFGAFIYDAPTSGLTGAGEGGGGGGCAMRAGPLGAAGSAGAVAPILTLLAGLAILRRRARPALARVVVRG